MDYLIEKIFSINEFEIIYCLYRDLLKFKDKLQLQFKIKLQQQNWQHQRQIWKDKLQKQKQYKDKLNQFKKINSKKSLDLKISSITNLIKLCLYVIYTFYYCSKYKVRDLLN